MTARRAPGQRRALVGIVVGVVGGLAACAGDGQVREPTGTTTTVVPAPSSTPSPRRPSAAPAPSEHDVTVPPPAPDALAGPPSTKAAGEVAAYFMALSPYAEATGDLDAWTELSGEACAYCANARTIVEDLAARHQRAAGGEIVVTDTQVSPFRKDEYAVLLRLTQAPAQTLDSSGAVVEDFPDTIDVSADMLVVWSRGGWRVDSVVVDVHGRS